MTARVAIVGAGPAGCYLAQALRRLPEPPDVDVLDRLAVPFGLVRHGIAADHQGTKAVARQFARVFSKGGARFLGRTELGRDVSLDDLRARYTAVVLATGAPHDRTLDIPGADLQGVHASGDLTRALNDHPEAEPLPDLGPRPVIVGAGNVALDLARLLSRDAEGLEGSDLSPSATRWLLEGGPRAVTIIARGALRDARFDPAMLTELAGLSHLRIEVPDARRQEADEAGDVADALRRIDGAGDGMHVLRILFRHRPVRVMGDAGHVEGVEVETPEGLRRIHASSVVAAIGARASAPPSGMGLHAVGWCAGAARGALPEARRAAQALAGELGGALGSLPRPSRPPLPAGPWDWAAWTAIDVAEQAAASPGRVRRKFTDEATLMAAARGRTS